MAECGDVVLTRFQVFNGLRVFVLLPRLAPSDHSQITLRLGRYRDTFTKPVGAVRETSLRTEQSLQLPTQAYARTAGRGMCFQVVYLRLFSIVRGVLDGDFSTWWCI